MKFTVMVVINYHVRDEYKQPQATIVLIGVFLQYYYS